MLTRCLTVLLTVVVSLTCIRCSPARAGDLKAGAATSNITPPIGGEIIGGFSPYPSTHIHDELHARCLVLDDGQTKLALVVCDLLGIHRNVSSEARKLIQSKVGIPAEHVLISATHTHSATSALGKDRMKMQTELDDYQQFVATRIADGVARANNVLKPAELAFGTVDIPEHLNNRRWHMRPGTVPANPFGGQDLVKMNPPAGSPNLIEPAGPIDPTVSFLSVRTRDGKPISVYAAYSLHYVGGVGATDISADYFAMFSEHLKQLMQTEPQDPPFVAMLANGTSGDINNINFRNPRPSKPPYQHMRYVAEDVASKVHAALKPLTYESSLSLSAAYREPELGWRRPTAEQLKWMEATLAKGPQSKQDLSFIYAGRVQRLAEYPPTTTVPVQVLKIGDVGIGTMPCEVFCEIGLDFKRESAIKHSFMVSLGHGYFGYLPTPRHIDLGGYETWIGTNRLERTASDKLLAQLIEMSRQLTAK